MTLKIKILLQTPRSRTSENLSLKIRDMMESPIVFKNVNTHQWNWELNLILLLKMRNAMKPLIYFENFYYTHLKCVTAEIYR